jgi:hypothetical protein
MLNRNPLPQHVFQFSPRQIIPTKRPWAQQGFQPVGIDPPALDDVFGQRSQSTPEDGPSQLEESSEYILYVFHF